VNPFDIFAAGRMKLPLTPFGLDGNENLPAICAIGLPRSLYFGYPAPWFATWSMWHVVIDKSLPENDMGEKAFSA